MSERKVLNKYYPPDFDPNKVPRNKVKKNYTFTIRTMAPFHMKCLTCGEYIYKGRKFNSRHENVPDENYLGLRISRFYIKCPRCAAEIVYKTDIENQDYKMEAGATRCFENLLNARRKEVLEAQREQEELEKNPMKMVEMKAKSTLMEEEIQGSLKDLEELRTRQRASEAILHGEKIKDIEEDELQEEENEFIRQQQEQISIKKSSFDKDLNFKLVKPIKIFNQSQISSSKSTDKLRTKLLKNIKIKKKNVTNEKTSKISNPLSALAAYSSDESNGDSSDGSNTKSSNKTKPESSKRQIDQTNADEIEEKPSKITKTELI